MHDGCTVVLQSLQTSNSSNWPCLFAWAVNEHVTHFSGSDFKMSSVSNSGPGVFLNRFLLEAGRPLLAGTGAFVGPAVW